MKKVVEKKKRGNKLKYESEKEMAVVATEYFDMCERKKLPPEKAGLCIFLNISRDTYSEYRKRYPDTIKRMDTVIESWWVRRLSGNAATGAIFYLKNAFKEEYKDRHETDITSKGEQIHIYIPERK